MENQGIRGGLASSSQLKATSSYLLLLLLCLPLSQSAPMCRYTNYDQIVTCNSLQLTNIPQGAFSPFSTNLIFNDNQLKSIELDTFQKYPSLVNLNLYSNKIDHIDESAFHNLASLRKLDLSNNELSLLADVTISSNPVLEALSLNNNPLILMPSLESSTLRSFYLRGCTLMDVPAGSFSRLPSLQTIDLRDNLLDEVPGDLFATLTRLTSVYLQGNPWRCSPRLEEMLEKYKDVIVDMDGLICFDPDGEMLPVSSLLALRTTTQDYYSSSEELILNDDLSELHLLIEIEHQLVPASPVESDLMLESLLFYCSLAMLSFLTVFLLVLIIVCLVALIRYCVTPSEVPYEKSLLSDDYDEYKIDYVVK